MKIKIYDGHNVIGGNKIFVESNSGNTIILDFGKNFATYGKYFEEFLTPRAGSGIYDFWKLNLIPHLNGLYRKDLALYLNDEVEQSPGVSVSALFLSHAHLDHAGFIPFIREDIPIITSSISYKILRSLEDTGTQGMLYEYCKASEAELKQGVNEEKISKKRGSEKPRNFIFDKSGSIADFKYEVFPVDHSILGASALFIIVDGVKIAYTGDLRFHGKNRDKTDAFFDFLKSVGVDVLITEGTRVPPKDDIEKTFKETQLTEDDVKHVSSDVVHKFKGKLVIADFGARNIERLETFLDVAIDSGRKLAVTLKDAYLLHLLKSEGLNLIENEALVIVESKREQNKKWVKEMSDFYKDRFITMKDIGKNPYDYILCYSYWDMPNLLDITIEDGAYIYSTSEAFSEEQMIDTLRLFNWLNYFNLKPFGVALEDGKPVFTREFHASGHASFKDLVQAIEKVKPKVLLPIHSESIETYKEYFGDSIKVHLDEELVL
jgi:ribonuclease J